MKELLNKMKEDLKSDAKELRKLKDDSKDHQRKNYGAHNWTALCKMEDAKRDYRHLHIAYCELRGTPREMIEQPRDGNEPDDTLIQTYKDHYLELFKDDEAAQMRLYVLVRKDLQPSYQAVQAGHAVAEFMLEHTLWKNSYLIYLGVKHERELEKWLYKSRELPHAIFREPDIDNEMTAIAVLAETDTFKRLNLL